MDTRTGQVFDSKALALDAGIPADRVVEVFGTREQVDALSAQVAKAHAADERKRARRKTQQGSRRANRS